MRKLFRNSVKVFVAVVASTMLLVSCSDDSVGPRADDGKPGGITTPQQ